MTPGSFLQQGPLTSNRLAGMLIYRERCPSANWRMASNQALVVRDFGRAAELMRILEAAGKRLLEALGLSFVAFDFSRDVDAPPRDDSVESIEAASSSSAQKALFLNLEVSVYNFFAPDLKAPIPVLIDDPKRYPSLDPRYTRPVSTTRRSSSRPSPRCCAKCRAKKNERVAVAVSKSPR